MRNPSWGPRNLQTLHIKDLILSGTITFPLGTGPIPTVKDFGCVGDGVTNDTARFQAALNTATVLLIPAGNYKVGSLTIPSTLRMLLGVGPGAAKLTASGLSAGAHLLSGNANTDGLHIGGFTVNLSTSFTTSLGIYLTSSNKFRLHHIEFTNSGAGAIRADVATDAVIEDVQIANFLVGGIIVNDASRVHVRRCYVVGDGTQSFHNIQIVGPGTDCTVTDCVTVNNSTHFGVNLYKMTRGIISRCIAYNGLVEGFNFQNCEASEMRENVVYASASSQDFGMSMFGDGVGQVLNCSAIGNVIYQPGKAGIALAENCVGCMVSDNHIINPNQLNQAFWGGVTLYGPGCQHNVAQGNYVYDTTAKCKYGVNEANIGGTGNPNNNRIVDNMVDAGGLTAETVLLGAGSLVWQTAWSTWAATLTPAAGAITAYSFNSAMYRVRGKTVEVQFDVSISNNGTGSGVPLAISTPPGFAASTNSGAVVAQETNLTGSTCSGVVHGTGINLRTYNNGYPGGNGARIVGAGIYRAA